MKKHILFNMLTLISLIIIPYIIVLSLFIKIPEDFRLPSFFIAPFIIVSIFIGIKALIATNKLFKSSWSFLLLLGLLTLIPRLIWIFFIHTKPISDFVLYNQYALNACNGILNSYHHTYALFPFKFGYPLILSLAYKILGSQVISGLILNVLLSLLTSFSIYWLGKNIFQETAGRISAILFALWPAQIMYNSVLASEHVFIIFFIISIGMLIKTSTSINIKYKAYYSLLSGLSLAIANQIRPVSLLIIPAYLLFIFLFNGNKLMNKFEIIEKTKTMVLILGAYSFFFLLVSLPLSSLIGVQIWKASAGYNIMVGTNYGTSGTYSSNDEATLSPYKNDYATFHYVGLRTGIERITTSPLSFLALLEKKVIIMWGAEEYGYFWSTNALTSTNSFSNLAQTNPRALKLISQIFYINVLILAAIGCLFAKKNSITSSSALMIIFLGLFLSYSILEVQSRYHFPAIPLLMVFSGYGVIYAKKLLPINIIHSFIFEKNIQINNVRYLHSIPPRNYIKRETPLVIENDKDTKVLVDTLKT